jgi:hypothetical protein
MEVSSMWILCLQTKYKIQEYKKNLKDANTASFQHALETNLLQKPPLNIQNLQSHLKVRQDIWTRECKVSAT